MGGLQSFLFFCIYIYVCICFLSAGLILLRLSPHPCLRCISISPSLIDIAMGSSNITVELPASIARCGCVRCVIVCLHRNAGEMVLKLTFHHILDIRSSQNSNERTRYMCIAKTAWFSKFSAISSRSFVMQPVDIPK